MDIKSTFAAPICAKCRVRMEVVRLGQAVLERRRGRQWRLWQGDSWECPKCGAQVVSNWREATLRQGGGKTFAEAISEAGEDLLELRTDADPTFQAAIERETERLQSLGLFPDDEPA